MPLWPEIFGMEKTFASYKTVFQSELLLFWPLLFFKVCQHYTLSWTKRVSKYFYMQESMSSLAQQASTTITKFS